jgi:hypothetical protein
VDVVVEVAAVGVQMLRQAVGDLDHRQHAALDVQRVALPGELLLLDQQFLASNQPLVSRHGLRQGHSALLWIALHRAFDP